MLFIIPSKLDFLWAFSNDPSKRPTKPSPGLIDWKTIHEKMHWSLIFVLGGGFAIATGSTDSGLSTMLGEALGRLRNINVIATLIIICLFAETVTELTANVAVANIILPVLAEMVNRLYYCIVKLFAIIYDKKKKQKIRFAYCISVKMKFIIFCFIFFMFFRQ